MRVSRKKVDLRRIGYLESRRFAAAAVLLIALGAAGPPRAGLVADRQNTSGGSAVSRAIRSGS